MPAKPAPIDRVRPLVRTRQVREFTPEPPTDAELDALTEVARWSGSSENSQPWRFIVVRDRAVIERLHEAGLPPTRSLRTALAAIAIVVPDGPDDAISHAYDEGRVAERLLVGATLLDLAAGIAWLRPDVQALAAQLFGLPGGWLVRTIVVVGHPTEAARQPKAAPGQARLPADAVVFRERWPRT